MGWQDDPVVSAGAAAPAWANDPVVSRETTQTVSDKLGRQLGLTARAGIEGVGGAAGLLSDPIGAIINQFMPTDGPKAKTARSLASELADVLGLPKPESTSEKIVGSAAEAMAGAGGTVGAARGAASLLSGIPQKVASSMAAQPLQQLAGAAGSGGAAEATKQAGGGESAQIAAALAGGVAGSLAVSRVGNTTRAAEPSIVKEAEAAGIPLMTSDASPPSTFVGRTAQTTGERIPIAGTGPLRAEQQAARQKAVRTLVSDYGADVATRFDDQIAAELLKRRGGDLAKYSVLKSAALNEAMAATPGPVQVPKALQQIDAELAALDRLGPVVPESAKQVLLDFRDSVQNKTVTDLDSVRRILGDQLKSPELASARSLTDKIPSRIYGALKEDIGSYMRQAGGRAHAKWSVANQRLTTLAAEADNAKLRTALNTGNETPEAVSAMLFSSKPSEVKTLYRNLTPEGREVAKTAIIAKAFAESAKDGAENVSPKVFSNQIGRLGSQVGVFFSKPEVERIESLRRVLIATQRAGEFAANPPTGVQVAVPVGAAVLTDLLGGFGAGVTAAASIGGLARAYESAPVRGLLMRMRGVKTGSPEELALAKRVLEAMQATQGDVP